MTSTRKNLTKAASAGLLALTLLGSVAGLAFSGDPAAADAGEQDLPRPVPHWEKVRVP